MFRTYNPKHKAYSAKGFTLIEIIVVLIIIGIIATLGLTQYTAVVEKGRTAEAKTNLGTLRTLCIAQYQEYGDYNIRTSAYSLPPACNSSYYYTYAINNSSGTGTATRCTDGGKPPPGPSNYTVTLTIDGTMTSTY